MNGILRTSTKAKALMLDFKQTSCANKHGKPAVDHTLDIFEVGLFLHHSYDIIECFVQNTAFLLLYNCKHQKCKN